MPQISVIIPVYKVEKYLARCLDSVLNQTFSDFEIILVDDGSPDNCGAICDEYAAKDKRVHVIHQANGGLSAARNAGIDWVFANSDSQWLTFIDSDDWVHADMLSVLYNASADNNVNVSVCKFWDTDGDEPEIRLSEFTVKLYYPEHYIDTVACGKLYHRECFCKIRFPVGKLHEDEFTVYRILFQQTEIAVTEAPLYFYYHNSAGITKSPWTPKRLDAVEARRQQAEFFKRNGFVDAYNSIVPEYVATIMEHRKCVQDSDLTAEEKKRYEKYLLRSLRKALWNYKDVLLQQERWVLFEAFPWLIRIYKKIKQKC